MRRDIEFKSAGETVRGWLYTPDAGRPIPRGRDGRRLVLREGARAAARRAAVRRHRARRDSLRLPELRVERRTRRQHIDPNAQIEDYRNAISFAETLGEVDSERIGVWGLSYSGGHALILGATDPRVKCVSAQIPVVDGYRNMRRVHGTIGFRRFEQLLLDDRRARFVSGEDGFLPHAAPDPASEVSTWPFPETYETFLELKQREAPAYENRSTIESAELLMSYNVGPFLPRLLDVPTQVIVAEKDDLTLWDLEIEAYNQIPTAKKRLVVIGGSTHMTLYSDRSLLGEAAVAASDWFARHLLAGHTSFASRSPSV